MPLNVPDPKKTYSDDGEVLFVLGLSMFGMTGAFPMCAAVVADAKREAAVDGKKEGRDFYGRLVVATYRNAADALVFAMAMEPGRGAVAYVRAPGGAWAMMVPIDIDGGRIAARRSKLKGVRAKVKPTGAQQLPGRWLTKVADGVAYRISSAKGTS